jgi:hypothetical protein
LDVSKSPEKEEEMKKLIMLVAILTVGIMLILPAAVLAAGCDGAPWDAGTGQAAGAPWDAGTSQAAGAGWAGTGAAAGAPWDAGTGAAAGAPWDAGVCK